ncbi:MULTISPECIES: 5'/3'-nucleotidase SurE [unclassified Pseudactinotalea]|uniref:5'/3'-nucleotidase SurE n=1 Tax=unclassified Pseudactinotalea TaxID=2649176 RepID=UPI003C7C7927
MRVLITNDDGVSSPGLTVLANVAHEAGHEVIIAAPNRQYSGYSAALSAENGDNTAGYPSGPSRPQHGLRISTARPPGISDDVESIAVHASPAAIAYAAGMGAFGPRPDLVLSGINLGPNVGPAVVHSGTVGAALSAAAQGIPALAASSASFDPEHWDTAYPVIAEALHWLKTHPQDGRVLNINIPDVPLERLRGLRPAELATFGTLPDTVDRSVRQILFAHMDDSGEAPATFPEGTDVHELMQGWATLSLIRAPRHDVHDAALPAFDDLSFARGRAGVAR